MLPSRRTRRRRDAARRPFNADHRWGRCTLHNSKTYLLPLARFLMSSLFIWDGILQLRDPSGTIEYFANLNVPVPDVAIWVSSAIHLLGGLAILVGFKTQWAAAVLVLL